MPPLTTWLVRHGESASNAGMPTVGNAEIPLTELGFAQSRAVADRIDRAPSLLVTSPFLRSRETAQVIAAHWPETPTEIWPIQEFAYLSAARCHETTVHTRQPFVRAYWERADPFYLDGEDAESFAQFMDRLRAFHTRLLDLDEDFVIAVGHGQFFRAYLFGMHDDFPATSERMRAYRTFETGNPMANGEAVALTREDFATRG
jgi:broad specificity phosphatase PhoE